MKIDTFSEGISAETNSYFHDEPFLLILGEILLQQRLPNIMTFDFSKIVSCTHEKCLKVVM